MSVPLKAILEAALLAAGEPLSLEQLQSLFPEGERPDKGALRETLDELAGDCRERGIALREVAGGYRFQVREDLIPWVGKLFQERPPRYSRALLETLAIIAYRQPITRGEIEAIRGVSTSSSVMRTLLDQEWIKVKGHKEVPGRPALYVTTRRFLEQFNLRDLSELPPLPDPPKGA
ncbi:MAG: SMC-Scp complex subunit ScpB [Gammaproteobacteria bacterium]|nr:MAG: SMC-Scp complex subunit ScpB [Gammaproteobacteria bacterium]